MHLYSGLRTRLSPVPSACPSATTRTSLSFAVYAPHLTGIIKAKGTFWSNVETQVPVELIFLKGEH